MADTDGEAAAPAMGEEAPAKGEPEAPLKGETAALAEGKPEVPPEEALEEEATAPANRDSKTLHGSLGSLGDWLLEWKRESGAEEKRPFGRGATGKILVYITRSGLPDCLLENLLEKCDVLHFPEPETPRPRATLLDRIRDVSVLLCQPNDEIDAEVMDAAGLSLRMIQTFSVGYDHIDVAAAEERGIKLYNTPGVSPHAIAEHTVAIMMALSRQIVKGSDLVRKDKWTHWSPNWMMGHTIKGATIGFVGFGKIGQAIAHLLRGLDVGEMYYMDKEDRPQAVELKATRVANELDLAKISDFVIAACILNDKTRGMFDAEFFSYMKPTGYFINTTRGRLVNQCALYKALVQNKIAGAGIDVMYPCPMSGDHPLLTAPNLLVTPHIAANTVEAQINMAKIATENILDFVESFWDG